MPSSEFGRVKQLDGIRTIAVGAVIVAHTGLSWLVPGGLGVTIFFFLSGYLITSLLRAENYKDGTISLSQFYFRRLIRIFPPLYITLLFCYGIVRLKLINVPNLDGFTVFSQFAFFQNYASLWGDPTPLPITSVWSLAVEEHYYLVFPVLYLVFLRKLQPRTQVLVCLAIGAIALGLRFLNVATLADYSVNYRWTHTRIDSIVFGACLALSGNPAMDKDAWKPAGWHAMLALFVLFLSLVIRNPVFRETLRYTIQGGVLYVLFAYVISTDGWVSRALSSKTCSLIARYSYTLYLVHSPLMGVMAGLGFFPHPVAILVAVVLAWIYAMLMFRFVERPLSQLRHNSSRPRAREAQA